MTVDEVVARLEGGGTISIDTNISRSSDTMERILELVERDLDRVQVVVAAPVFFEIMSYLRRKFGPTFRADKIAQFIAQNLSLSIEPFTREDAEHLAACLTTRFGGDSAWQQAKIDLALRHLHLGQPQLGNRARSGATVDWLVAGQASHRGWLLATEDTGADMAWFGDRMSYDTLFKALGRLGETVAPAE